MRASWSSPFAWQYSSMYRVVIGETGKLSPATTTGCKTRHGSDGGRGALGGVLGDRLVLFDVAFGGRCPENERSDDGRTEEDEPSHCEATVDPAHVRVGGDLVQFCRADPPGEWRWQLGLGTRVPERRSQARGFTGGEGG